MEKIQTKSLDILLEESRIQKEVILQTIINLDTKSSIVIGLIGILLTIIFTNTYFYHYFLLKLSFANFLIFSCIGFLFIALFISLYSIRLTKYRFDPNLRPLIEKNCKSLPVTLKKQLLSHYTNSFEHNIKRIGQKGELINSSLLLIFFALIMLAVRIFLR